MKWNKENPLRVVELFAGIGCQREALKMLKEEYPDFDFKVVGISEIDKHALISYEAAHGDCPNWGDVSKIDWSDKPDFDLMTYSSPCQDFSNAGKQAGGAEGSGTRSSLLWECRRAVIAKRPKYLIFENVKAVAQKKFMPLFQKWIDELDSYGYSSYWQVCNSKNYGTPQNRERVFMISILRTEDNPKPTYNFPQPFPLELRLKDVLEENVDESFYLRDEQVQRIIEHCDRKVTEGCGFKPQICRPKEITFDTPLKVEFNYVPTSGMASPYYEISLSRECFVGELVAEMIKIVGNTPPVKAVHFDLGCSYVSFDSLEDALQSKAIVEDTVGTLNYGWMSPEPEWRFRGFYIVNP